MNAETMVVRGGVGHLYSLHLIAMVRNSVANRNFHSESSTSALESRRETFIGRSTRMTRAVNALGRYAAARAKSVFSNFDTDMQLTYRHQFDAEREASDW